MRKAIYLEKHGPMNPDDGCFNGICGDHFIAMINHDGDLSIQIDNYHPNPVQSWDGEEWESKSCLLLSRPSKRMWSFFYRVARVVSREGKARIQFNDGRVLEVIAQGLVTYDFT